jgi:hypothetical protein
MFVDWSDDEPVLADRRNLLIHLLAEQSFIFPLFVITGRWWRQYMTVDTAI